MTEQMNPHPQPDRRRAVTPRAGTKLERGAVGGLVAVLIVLAALTTWTVLHTYREGNEHAAGAEQFAGYQATSDALNRLDRLEDRYEERPTWQVRKQVADAEIAFERGVVAMRAGSSDHELTDWVEPRGDRIFSLLLRQFDATDSGATALVERIESQGSTLLERTTHRIELAGQSRLTAARALVEQEHSAQVPLLWATLAITALALIFSAFAARFLRVRRRAAEASALEAQRAKDEFMALISHELRTPLTSILGYSELMIESDSEQLAASGKEFSEIIARNARRELRLVEDLLDLTQLDAGQFRVEIRDAELSQIVNDAVDSARLKAAEKDIAISAEIEPLPSCSGDTQRLAQTCDNLISNAIKFTPDGGTIAVSLHLEGEAAILSVEDSGIGIPADDLKDVFVRMFRTKKAEHIPGSGLGLAITKAIIDAHGGDIEVESKEDEGSVFTIRMPMAPNPVPA